MYLVDAMIRTGEIRHGMVVSGEYISYLIDTAQREITDFMDPQIASLTLGDAGVAVSLGLSPSPDCRPARLGPVHAQQVQPVLCRQTDRQRARRRRRCTPTRSRSPSRSSRTPRGTPSWSSTATAGRWTSIDHIVPHQTSQLTMNEAKKEIQRLYQYDFGDCFLNNLAERGNTSSNSHFLAVFDAITFGEDRLRKRQNLAFCISGSGQTTGTALYTMDDLPSRLANGHANGSANMSAQRPCERQTSHGARRGRRGPAGATGVRLGRAWPNTDRTAAPAETLDHADAAAAEDCLGKSSFSTAKKRSTC